MNTASTSAPPRQPASAILQRNPIVAVLRAKHAGDYAAVIDVLVANGVRSIELTLSTPGTFDTLEGLRDRFGTDAEIGVGTIVTPDDASRAIDLGAAYLVAPVMQLATIDLAVANGIPVFPGGLTPTELFTGWNAGATAVKIFPAETVGAQYGAHLRGPFPGIQFIPSGGIGLDAVASWLDAGAMAVSLGGPLIGDAFSGGSLSALADRARLVTRIAEDARPVR